MRGRAHSANLPKDVPVLNQMQMQKCNNRLLGSPEQASWAYLGKLTLGVQSPL